MYSSIQQNTRDKFHWTLKCFFCKKTLSQFYILILNLKYSLFSKKFYCMGPFRPLWIEPHRFRSCSFHIEFVKVKGHLQSQHDSYHIFLHVQYNLTISPSIYHHTCLSVANTVCFPPFAISYIILLYTFIYCQSPLLGIAPAHFHQS